MSGVALLAGVGILAVIFGAAGALVFDAVRQHERTARTGRGDGEVGLIVLARLLAPVWLLLVVATLWLLILVFLALNRADAGTDPLAIRWTVLGFVGLITALGALVTAPLALIRVQTTERQTRTAEQGHMTDRISHAVEQLGAEKTVKEEGKDGGQIERSVPNIEVRIGGILSLERIAQDSTTYDKGRDHVRVMEILCAYIRENAPASGAKDHDFGDWEPLPDDASGEDRAAHLESRKKRFVQHEMKVLNLVFDGIPITSGEVQEWAQFLDPPREDIALALLVIGRRDARQGRVEARWRPDAKKNAEWVFDNEKYPCPELPDPPDDAPHPKGAVAAYKRKLRAWKDYLATYRGYCPDLRGTNLQRADLSGLVLSGARLDGARMEGADLSGARLEGAVLFRARMEGANLFEARMEGANLEDARMEGAWLHEVRMEGAVLFRARMDGAELGAARMEGAALVRARMEWANLGRARMAGAILSEARMEGADLSRARMERAILTEARMEGVVLEGARMDSDTSLSAAVLQSAALKDVTLPPGVLSADQIATMFGDGSVTLPDDLDRPPQWPAAKLGVLDFRNEWRRWQDEGEAYIPPERRADA